MDIYTVVYYSFTNTDKHTSQIIGTFSSIEGAKSIIDAFIEKEEETDRDSKKVIRIYRSRLDVVTKELIESFSVSKCHDISASSLISSYCYGVF